MKAVVKSPCLALRAKGGRKKGEERLHLEAGDVVETEGTDKARKAPDKDGKGGSPGSWGLTEDTIFDLIDAGKALPATPEDREYYIKRGQIVPIDTAEEG